MAQSLTEPYTFFGTILPQRAQLSLDFKLGFSHSVSGFHGRAHVSIILNQLVVEIFSDEAWDIFDLRNVVLSIVEHEVAAIGYSVGRAYDVEITRVLRRSRSVDYVFGVDVPCISEPRKDRDLETHLQKLREIRVGSQGVYIDRCFADLRLAMHRANDTAFHCYRAIESLRHHCAAMHGLAEQKRNAQWEKFRTSSGVSKEELGIISNAARSVRHGEHSGLGGTNRAELFELTWAIVDRYIETL